jgi:hypothetical protein
VREVVRSLSIQSFVVVGPLAALLILICISAVISVVGLD